MAYRTSPFNHMFKDDYIYISYKEKLRMKSDDYGFKYYENYDVRICDWYIVDMVLAAEIYPGYDTTEIREQIGKKHIWFRDKYRESYDQEVKFD